MPLRSPNAIFPSRRLPRAAVLIALSLLMVAAAPPSASQLHAAVRADDLAEVKRLLAESPAPSRLESRDERGRTPLLLATGLNRVAIARALVAAGADVNAKDHQQDSPYLLAGAEGRLEILKLTLAHGADLTSTNRYGGTALIPAAERGHVEVVRTLIAAGVRVDHVNRLGWTALLEAVLLSDGGPAHQEIIRQLIAAGANVNLPDREGVSPLQHAVQRGHKASAAILRAAGAR